MHQDRSGYGESHTQILHGMDKIEPDSTLTKCVQEQEETYEHFTEKSEQTLQNIFKKQRDARKFRPKKNPPQKTSQRQLLGQVREWDKKSHEEGGAYTTKEKATQLCREETAHYTDFQNRWKWSSLGRSEKKEKLLNEVNGHIRSCYKAAETREMCWEHFQIKGYVSLHTEVSFASLLGEVTNTILNQTCCVTLICLHLHLWSLCTLHTQLNKWL